MIVDLLCSEYGWSKDYVLEQVTPAQAGLLLSAIGARQRQRLAQEMAMLRLAMWGDERQFAHAEHALLGDDDPEHRQTLAAMGIAVKGCKRGEPGHDDGQPAG